MGVSMYNMVNGANPAVFILLPMLGKHPDKYPRFRDCFSEKRKLNSSGFGTLIIEKNVPNSLFLLLRVGGSNREDHKDAIEELIQSPGYVSDWDDEFDSTFAWFEFKVPEKWRKDYALIMSCEMDKVSKEYQDQMCGVFPKLSDKFRQLWESK